MSTIFTMPGKLGDAVMQTPVAYWYAREHGRKVRLWLDEGTCAPLISLLKAQDWIEDAELRGGVTSYQCGGQPWFMGLETKDFEGHTLFHLGLRSFPARQLTLEAFEQSKTGLKIDPELLSRTPVFHVQPHDPRRRVVLHGQPVYAHTRTTPGFWRFLARIAPELERDYDEIVWVGTERDREVGTRTYPSWQQFDDGGSFLKLAELIAGSSLMIGVGSAPITLAGALKIPGVRVHDPIGDAARVIWDNLAYNNLNRTEIELRDEWPKFKARHLTNRMQAKADAVAEAGL